MGAEVNGPRLLLHRNGYERVRHCKSSGISRSACARGVEPATTGFKRGANAQHTKVFVVEREAWKNGSDRECAICCAV